MHKHKDIIAYYSEILFPQPFKTYPGVHLIQHFVMPPTQETPQL